MAWVVASFSSAVPLALIREIGTSTDPLMLLHHSELGLRSTASDSPDHPRCRTYSAHDKKDLCGYCHRSALVSQLFNCIAKPMPEGKPMINMSFRFRDERTDLGSLVGIAPLPDQSLSQKIKLSCEERNTEEDSPPNYEKVHLNLTNRACPISDRYRLFTRALLRRPEL